MKEGMRRFLYYDEDSVNSFLAQIESGLITHDRNEGEETKTISTSTSTTGSVTGDLSAKVVGIGASLAGEVEALDSETDATTKLVKGVQEKILHDYAFDKIFNYFKSNNLIVESPESVGDIVLINEKPTFLDFGFFQQMFSDDGIVKYFNDKEKLQIQETIATLRKATSNSSQLPPDQKAKIPEMKANIKKLEEQLKTTDSSRKETEELIAVFRNTIPYNRSLMMENYLIPCNDKKFRDDPNIVAFKYGGNVSILGYITNIVTSNKEQQESSSIDFAGMYSTLNQVMLSLFNKKERIFILHPIALFY